VEYWDHIIQNDNIVYVRYLFLPIALLCVELSASTKSSKLYTCFFIILKIAYRKYLHNTKLGNWQLYNNGLNDSTDARFTISDGMLTIWQCSGILYYVKNNIGAVWYYIAVNLSSLLKNRQAYEVGRNAPLLFSLAEYI